MSLDKAIQHNKEYRKKYTGSKAIDSTCRNHGSCDWCKENRLYQYLKERDRREREIEEYMSEDYNEDDEYC